jgi:peptidoglycan glycosyltransferase
MNVNRAIGRLALVFVAAYALLFARQLFVQTIEGPQLAGNPHNPRTALLAPYRGEILARDGTVLARSVRGGRVYPFGRALAQVVGYDSARYGSSGLEAAFDRDLSARPISNDPFVQLEQLLGNVPAAPALDGASVFTTLDPVVQSTLFEELSAYPRAAGVVLDPRTGEVLALASVPSFDPGAIDASFKEIAGEAASPLLDRATDGLYPPGSTFKIFTAAAALEAGVVTTDSTFEDPGYFRVGDFSVHDDEGEATGTQDLTGAFALSSNVDFAQVALSLGSDRWFEAARAWGLAEPIDFTLPVARDHLPAPATVTPSILAQLGFGQADLLVTPMRMALVASAIADDGTAPRPYLVSHVRSQGRDDARGRPTELASPISPAVAAQVREMMVAAVERGTGTAAAIPGVSVAGKTGTATNPAGTSHAWFVAFAPAGSAKVAVAILVENAGYGGAVAAPIARRVLAVALARVRS